MGKPGRQKGDGKGRLGGRAAGTPNKITVLTKEIIQEFVAENYDAAFDAWKAIKAEKTPEQEVDKAMPHIEGDAIVYPYDIKTYYIHNAEMGQWQISNNKARIIAIKENAVEVDITTGRSGEFQLIYNQNNEDNIVLNITIESL